MSASDGGAAAPSSSVPCQRCHWIIPPEPKSVDDQTPIIPAPSDAYRSVPLRPPERNM